MASIGVPYSTGCYLQMYTYIIIFTVFFTCFLISEIGLTKVPNTHGLIENLDDLKEFKKILRTKTNVLVLYAKNGNAGAATLRLLEDVANEAKGIGTLGYADCNGDAKKICKKFRISPEGVVLKHYKDGEYHKDYDRQLSLSSVVNFLKDPTGDLPWDEDDTATDVTHIATPQVLAKLFKKESRPVLIMFYAPWCGFCKRLKPDYAQVATELKSQAVIAAMDVNRPENSMARQHFNITGFPTIIYFESGLPKYRYEGDNNKQALIEFMRNPVKQPEKPKEEVWSDVLSDVVHLTDASFADFVAAHGSILVMFYAPWCGHCKAMKPEYVKAAAELKAQHNAGILAAVDATKQQALAGKFEIKGYPSVKYFSDGKFKFDLNVRTADKILEFMRDPKEPPPPPPPEKPWSETSVDVVHLTEDNFKTFLRKTKHVIVMFYAPWCGHCKRTKPEFDYAASNFRDDPKVALAAVDCTVEQAVCKVYDVKGYPTIKYFNYLKGIIDYEGGRTAGDFTSFLQNPPAVKTEL